MQFRKSLNAIYFPRWIKLSLRLTSVYDTYLFHGYCIEVSISSAIITRQKCKLMDIWNWEYVMWGVSDAVL